MKKLIFLLPVVSLTILLIGCQNTGNGTGDDLGIQDTQINAPDIAGEKKQVNGGIWIRSLTLNGFMVSLNQADTKS